MLGYLGIGRLRHRLSIRIRATAFLAIQDYRPDPMVRSATASHGKKSRRASPKTR